jgi:hypothetical protein
MRAFGIPFWRERLSDEEYVNSVRKGLRVVRWLRWLFVGLFIAVIAFCSWAVISMADFLTRLGGKEGPDRQLVYGVIGLAALSGCCLGFWIGHLGEVAANAFFGFRRDRLLIECWDALHQGTTREKKSQPKD